MKQLVKGSAALTAVSMGEMVMRFIRTKCIAIFLGPAGTGFLAQLMLFFEALRVWGELGARRAVIKQIAEQREAGRSSERYSEVIKTSYFVALLASGVTGLIVAVLSRQLSQMLYGTPVHYPYIIFLAALLPVASLSTVTASIVKGNLDYAQFAKYTFVSYLAVMAVTPLFVYTMHFWGGALVMGFFFLFPFIGYLIFNARSRFISFSKTISLRALKEQFSYGFVLIYQDSLLNLTRVLVASWIVKELGLSMMGIYQVVVTFSTVYMSIPIQAMSGYTFPVIAAATHPKEITRAINESLRFLTFVLVPVIVFLMVLPELFIHVFFSSEFIEAAHPLQIQLFGTLFILLGFPFSVALQAKGKLKALFFTVSVSSGIYVGLVWLLFGLGQLAGVSIAYAVSSMASTIMQYAVVRQEFEAHIVPKNQRLLIWTGAWMGLAWMVGLTHFWVLRILVLLLAVPWFLLSSKAHEREFLIGKLRALKGLKKYFEGKDLLRSLKL